MNLQEEVTRLKMQGIVKSDVQNSMRAKGFSDEEIDIAWSSAPAYREPERESEFGWKTILSILLVLFAVVRIIMRLSRD